MLQEGSQAPAFSVKDHRGDEKSVGNLLLAEHGQDFVGDKILQNYCGRTVCYEAKCYDRGRRMVQGRNDQAAIFGLQWIGQGGLQGVSHGIAMRDHRSFRSAGRSARIHLVEQVVLVDLRIGHGGRCPADQGVVIAPPVPGAT